MIRIRCIHSGHSPMNRDLIAQAQGLFREAFPKLADAADKIPETLARPVEHGYRAGLLLLERGMGRVDAFALVLLFPRCAAAFLDYIAARKSIRGGGSGTALYEGVREYCQSLGARSLYMEVDPDEPDLTPDPAALDVARKRIRFYEHYGVRAVVNPAYHEPVGDPPTTSLLLFDGLGRPDPPSRDEAREAVRMILTRRFASTATPRYVLKVLDGFRDDPIRLRPMRYVRRSTPSSAVAPGRIDRPFLAISSQKHRIHHVKARGYFERPMRVGALQAPLARSGLFTMIEPRAFPESVVTAVHDKDFVVFLKTICNKLAKDKPVYPDTFPVRRPRLRPKIGPEQAGYYCIDSCTPLDGNAYAAARTAANVAMTGAHEILAGRRVVYSLCRPPGHHAERRVYGGFCYFNNAAIAAHHLSRQARTAILDIDYHHGNGTQDIFYERGDVLTVSIHGHPDHAFPYFSGFADETGAGPGAGLNVNLPLPRETDEAAYLTALDKALRAVRRFKPEVLVVSLGLDILRDDPTGTFLLAPASMGEIARRLSALRLPLLIVQEGGYNLRGIKKGIAAFFGGLRETQ